MRGAEAVLCGIGAAVGYGLLARGGPEGWNAALATEIGIALTVTLLGFRSGAYRAGLPSAGARSAKDAAGASGGEGRDATGKDAALRPPAASGAPQPPQSELQILASQAPQLVPQAVPQPVPAPVFTSVPGFSFEFLSGTPDELWQQICAMETDLDPSRPIEECLNYMVLLYEAAEGGCVPALARLGELAYRRGVFVEAFFWTKLARRRLESEAPSDAKGLEAIDAMLRAVRRTWAAAGRPTEFENVHEHFPAERGELGRAFLRLDSGIEVSRTREYVHLLAKMGNPDAALFARI